MYPTDSWDGKNWLLCYIIIVIEYEAAFFVLRRKANDPSHVSVYS